MENQVHYNEVFDAQQHFRLLLDSMSRPGKINTIPFIDLQQPPAMNNACALVALALLNTDVGFCTANGNEVTRFIAQRTAATATGLSLADYVFIPGMHSAGFIAQLKIGTLSYPEDSATIIADVVQLSADPVDGALQVTLKGPGILGSETVYIAGLNPLLLDDLHQQNQEFPLGIDLILTDKDNHVMCIPRSSQFTYLPAGNNLIIIKLWDTLQ